jgi:hypothetical protein
MVFVSIEFKKQSSQVERLDPFIYTLIKALNHQCTQNSSQAKATAGESRFMR